MLVMSLAISGTHAALDARAGQCGAEPVHTREHGPRRLRETRRMGDNQNKHASEEKDGDQFRWVFHVSTRFPAEP
jgi:hypothetical protein